MAIGNSFLPEELIVREQIPDRMGKPIDVYTTPITARENMLLLYHGKTPMWPPFTGGEVNSIRIDVDPENKARQPGGGVDGYGVEWVFVDLVGGAMVRPGEPKVKDINHWEDYITIPDPDSWDWAECYERFKDRLSSDRLTYVGVPGCLFERLIAVMDFENAAVALIDDEQKEGVHRFFRAVTDVHKKFYRLCKKWFNADIMNFNDDWGSQRAEFYSVDTVREMLLPYMKELGECVHSLGMYWDLHCCGKVEKFVPIFIEEGMNSWGGQPMNDKAALKRQYGDKLIFTSGPAVPDNASDSEADAIIAEFFRGFAADNRCFIEVPRNRPDLRPKLYEAGRRNYDRLVAHGMAIL